MWARLVGDVIKNWIHKDKYRASKDKDQIYKNKDLKLIFLNTRINVAA